MDAKGKHQKIRHSDVLRLHASMPEADGSVRALERELEGHG